MLLKSNRQPYTGPYSSTQDELTSHRHADSEQMQIDLPELNTKKDTHFPGTTTANEARICGFRRKIFIVVIILILLVVVVIAGTVGGVLGKKKSAVTPAPSSTSSPSSPSPDPGNNSTVKTRDPMRQITTTQDRSTYFNFWQKANGELWMHAFYVDINRFTEPFKIETLAPAINNTPLAVLAWKYESYFEVRVSYMAEGRDSPTGLAFRCEANGMQCASPRDDYLDISGPKYKLVPGQASFLLSPELNKIRHYTIDNGGIVVEDAYDEDRTQEAWNGIEPLRSNAKAHKASPITAARVGDQIWLFWFDDQKKLKKAASNLTQSTWEIEDIDAPLPAELPRALGIAVSEDPKVVQVFFFDGIKMQYAKYRGGQNWIRGEWSSGTMEPEILEGSIEDGPMGVVGWNNTTVRMFFPLKGSRRIREVVFENDNRGWRMGGMSEDDYD